MKKKIDISRIDQIIDGKAGAQDGNNSIYTFAELLGSAVPQADPGFRQKLETQVLQTLKAAHAIPPTNRRENLSGNKPLLRRTPMKPKLAFMLAAAFAAAVMTVALVPGLGQTMFESIKRITLGKYTIAEQIHIIRRGELDPVPDDVWIVRTEIGNFAGNYAPAVPHAIQTVGSLDAAQQLVNFPVLSPASLPEGYQLSKIQVTPQYVQAVFLTYQGPGHEIILVMMQVGERVNDDPNSALAVKSGLITDGPVQETELNGKQAVWADGHTLAWEEGNTAFYLGGLDLDLETAMQIADSLQ